MKQLYTTAATVALCLGASAAVAQDDVVAQAREIVAEYSRLPDFVAPGPAFDAATCMADKSIVAIPFNSTIPFAQDIMHGFRDAAAAVGFDLREWENQGQPTQWASGIINAINSGADLIDIFGAIDPRTVEPQIVQATDAGLAVTAGHAYDLSQEPHPALTTSVPNDFQNVGRILAAWAIAQTEGNANVLVIGSDEVIFTDPIVSAIRAMIEVCDDCSMSYHNVPVTDWATRIQSVVQSSLLADPSINYVVPIYDSMSQFVEPALTLTGRTGQVKIASFNGTPFVVDMVREGAVEMVIGESPDWLGRVIIDHDMRTLCGVETYGAPNIPLMIWTAENAETAGVPASSTMGYGTNYIEEFYALWGLQ